MPVKPSVDEIPDLIIGILESNFWLPSIGVMTSYNRLHDDNDGTDYVKLHILFSEDGDARIWITDENMISTAVLRFRMPGQGGGLSPRTRMALLILAEAVRLDNESSPNSGSDSE